MTAVQWRPWDVIYIWYLSSFSIPIPICSDNTETEWFYSTCIVLRHVRHLGQPEKRRTDISWWMRTFLLITLRLSMLLRRQAGNFRGHPGHNLVFATLKGWTWHKICALILVTVMLLATMLISMTLSRLFAMLLSMLDNNTMSKTSDTPEMQQDQKTLPPKHRRNNREVNKTEQFWLMMWYKSSTKQSERNRRRLNPRQKLIRQICQRKVPRRWQKSNHHRPVHHSRNLPRTSWRHRRSHLRNTWQSLLAATADTTVKVEPKQPEGPPPPPPKRNTDTTVTTEGKRARKEVSKEATSTTNKIKVETENLGGPSSSSTSIPIPILPPAPDRTPQQPDHPPPPKEPGYPPPDRTRRPSKPPRKPFGHGEWNHPTPPPAPQRQSSHMNISEPHD